MKSAFLFFTLITVAFKNFIKLGLIIVCAYEITNVACTCQRESIYLTLVELKDNSYFSLGAWIKGYASIHPIRTMNENILCMPLNTKLYIIFYIIKNDCLLRRFRKKDNS